MSKQLQRPRNDIFPALESCIEQGLKETKKRADGEGRGSLARCGYLVPWFLWTSHSTEGSAALIHTAFLRGTRVGMKAYRVGVGYRHVDTLQAPAALYNKAWRSMP
jgi:hypothetical protein